MTTKYDFDEDPTATDWDDKRNKFEREPQKNFKPTVKPHNPYDTHPRPNYNPLQVPKKETMPSEMTEDEPVRRVVRGGWGSTKSAQTDSSEYAVRLKLTDDVQIVKFLEDEPFAYWRQHWVERQGQKSFICLADDGDCPLCKSGDSPSWKFAFNVVLLAPDAEPVLRSMEIGVRAKDQLRNFNDGQMTGPLSKHYWAVSRSGRGTTSATNFQMVRERDLEEWQITALTSDDLNHFGEKAYKPSIYIKPNRADLAKIVQEELS